jgi:hypothetical protein
MAVIKRTVREDGFIECLIESTNILKTEYNETTKEFIVTFKVGSRYKYIDVLNRDYVRFEISESQGSVFNKTMKNYKFEKLESVNVTPIKELINEISKG